MEGRPAAEPLARVMRRANAALMNPRRRRSAWPLALLLAALSSLLPAPAQASEAAHHDPSAAIALGLAILLVTAKLGGELAIRLGQPAVLGELLFGVVLGNVSLLGVPALEWLETDPSIDMLARLGVLLLLFEVGLESTVGQMLRVGLPALVVACVGVALPFGLGWAVGAWMLPSASTYVHAFLGAALSATSVGITARVLKDLGQSQSDEARVILGAAVIDDVLGLVILAVVAGVIAAADSGQALPPSAFLWILAKAAVFLVGALFLGVKLSPTVFNRLSRLRIPGVLLAFGLGFCFLLSWLASVIGLAPIVGAFAAGLVLEDLHCRDFTDRGERGLEELVHPISSFLVPIFFVVMGMRTELRSFAEPGVLGLAGALVVAAVIGKLACGQVVRRPGLDRLSIGIGMVPRGEVGLIFASVGRSLRLAGEPIVTPAIFSAVVVMVVVTTLVTPPALKWSLGRRRKREGRP